MPPLVGVAVKVTELFTQAEVLGVVIDTEGVTDPTVMVMAFDVAVVGDAHAELDVSTHVTTCPLVSVVVVNVGLLVPAFVPLTFH